MKKIRFIFGICLLFAFAGNSVAQTDSLATDSVRLPVVNSDTLPAIRHIALFAPLFLDSAYNAQQEFRYKNPLPSFFNPGLDFWEGAQMAIDSMRKEGLQFELSVYDTRSASQSLLQILQKPEMRQMDLLIGHVNSTEARLLAEAGKQLHIPFINANLPNDAGVTDNPDYIILNATLLTHCEGIYKFMQKNFALSPIVMFSKKGAQEDRLMSYLDSAAAATAAVPLTIHPVLLNDQFTAADLSKHLDSNTTVVCLAGSLDLGFAQRLAMQLASLSKNYHSIIIGMPTWDLIDFDKPYYKGTEIIYSTPFFYAPSNQLVDNFTHRFRDTYYANPSDMVFRGYETLYHFAHLLLLHKGPEALSMNENKFKLITDFNIQPVLSRPGFRLEYFENKKLYFVKKVDGQYQTTY